MKPFTWEDALSAIREGTQTIPTTPDGVPLVVVNAQYYELMQMMEALTTGYNAMVNRAAEDQKRIERIRKLAEANFPASRKATADHAADGWISVDDRLPPKSGCYLCWDADHPRVGVYGYDFSAKHRVFNAHDHTTLEQALKTAVHVTHWWPTPAPPAVKGKEED